MSSKNDSAGQKKRSFIEQARRGQIIDAAVAVIAEQGYGNASLARIAERVGVSKGVISYHFDGKDDLMHEVMVAVFTRIGEHVEPRMANVAGPLDALRQHVFSMGEYVGTHRDELVALTEIIVGSRRPDGSLKYEVESQEPTFNKLEELLLAGQQAGVFRDFDRRVMAVTIQASLDAAFGYWVAHPGHDLTAHLTELAEALERAVLAP